MGEGEQKYYLESSETQHLREIMQLQLGAVEKARTLQAEEYERRLALLNHEAAQLKDMQATYVPREVFEGTINAINVKVDDATRNVQVQATLSNAKSKLTPGMFAGVDVVLPIKNRFITLPQPAIVYNPYGNTVYVVEKSKDDSGADSIVARQRVVQLGETRGDQVAVLKGVQPGDEVVTSGQLKLRNGAAIAINNTVALDNNPAPTPPNN